MKRAIFGATVVSTMVLACKPSVGPPISSISGPAILAVKGEPAEVNPKSATTTVHYEALAVDMGGRVPNADIPSSMLWSMCDQPKPPTENNSVSTVCLDQDYLPGMVGDSPTTYTAPVPADSCQLFGPETPPAAAGQPAIRPRDPDVTGGYYLPVRTSLLIPEDLRRVGMATEDTLVAFQLQRIQCGLANVPAGVVPEYGRNYKLNNNPVLNPLTLHLPGSDPVPLSPVSAGSVPIAVPAGQAVSLVASWPIESVENFPAWDVLQHELLYHNEAMRVSWYATSGSFEHDVTGRGETETETYTENAWKPGEPGLVHLWLVLHDSRGGTDFASYDMDVTP